MLHQWWKRLFSRNTRTIRTRSPRAYHRRILWIEVLENRLAPATITWINPAGGDWGKAAKWSTNAPPGATDDVVIPALNSAAFVTHSTGTDTVNSISASAPISLSGGTLTVATTLQDSSPLTLAGGTMAGATVAAGTTITGTG